MGWQFIGNITPYEKQDRDNFIKERKNTLVGVYTKKASRIQHVVLSEQFREFYYNCVVNQRVVFDYVYYTGKTDVELQAILNHVLATNTWSFVKGTDQILYFFLVFVMLGELFYLVAVGLWCLNVTLVTNME